MEVSVYLTALTENGDAKCAEKNGNCSYSSTTTVVHVAFNNDKAEAFSSSTTTFDCQDDNGTFV